MEPDEVARAKLVEEWRASISHGELMLNGKSQVLCLAGSPLAENRLLPAHANDGVLFGLIVGDLWMSARRWLEWFGQVDKDSPQWLASLQSDAVRPNPKDEARGMPSDAEYAAHQWAMREATGQFATRGDDDKWAKEKKYSTRAVRDGPRRSFCESLPENERKEFQKPGPGN